jgi:peptidoglycan/xylan/chitin deacetylase (PgdA/CDA1 family)
VSAVRGVLVRAAATGPAQQVVSLVDRLWGAGDDVFAVLTYHRVDDPDARPWLYPPLLSATPEQFEAQMRMLVRRHRPVSMEQILDAHSGGPPLPRRAVHVTFDDAYADFASNAWPVLRRLDIPVTMFVPTAYPDRPERSFWWDRVWNSTTSRGGTDETDAQQRAAALIQRLKSLPHEQAMGEVDAYGAGQRAVDRAPDVLGWDDLRRLAGEGVLLGCHTRTHALLSRLAPAQLAAELSGAREDLEREVPGGRGTDVLAYPAGDYDQSVLRAAAETPFRLAFTTRRGANRVGRTPPLALRRINVGLRASASLIRAQLVLTGVQRRLNS